jgi:hypothetical protein
MFSFCHTGATGEVIEDMWEAWNTVQISWGLLGAPGSVDHRVQHVRQLGWAFLKLGIAVSWVLELHKPFAM